VRKRSAIPIPIELMAVIIGTLASTYINLQDEYGLQPVGDIPTGYVLKITHPIYTLI
jgi:solute carrier family 26 protein